MWHDLRSGIIMRNYTKRRANFKRGRLAKY